MSFQLPCGHPLLCSNALIQCKQRLVIIRPEISVHERELGWQAAWDRHGGGGGAAAVMMVVMAATTASAAMRRRMMRSSVGNARERCEPASTSTASSAVVSPWKARRPEVFVFTAKHTAATATSRTSTSTSTSASATAKAAVFVTTEEHAAKATASARGAVLLQCVRQVPCSFS